MEFSILNFRALHHNAHPHQRGWCVFAAMRLHTPTCFCICLFVTYIYKVYGCINLYLFYLDFKSIKIGLLILIIYTHTFMEIYIHIYLLYTYVFICRNTYKSLHKYIYMLLYLCLSIIYILHLYIVYLSILFRF